MPVTTVRPPTYTAPRYPTAPTTAPRAPATPAPAPAPAQEQVFPSRHPPNAAYVSPDGLVSYDAQGYRLDSVGNRAFGGGGGGGGGGGSAPTTAAPAPFASGERATTVPGTPAAPPAVTPPGGLGTGISTPFPSGARGTTMAKPEVPVGPTIGGGLTTTPTTTIPQVSGLVGAPTMTDTTLGVPDWWAQWFTGTFGNPYGYYTTQQGGIEQAAADYNALRTLWYNRTGRTLSPYDAQKLLATAGGYLRTLGRPPVYSDLYDWVELQTRERPRLPNMTYFNLGEF